MISDAYTVRYMGNNDLPAVVEVEEECFLCPWSVDDFRFSLLAEYDIGLVAVVDSHVAGFCIIRTSFDYADVINVAVKPSFQGKGIGRRLMEEVMKLGKERGVTSFGLEVRVSNAAAIALYHNVGFKEAGIRKAYYSMPVEDALIMTSSNQ